MTIQEISKELKKECDDYLDWYERHPAEWGILIKLIDQAFEKVAKNYNATAEKIDMMLDWIEMILDNEVSCFNLECNKKMRIRERIINDIREVLKSLIGGKK